MELEELSRRKAIIDAALILFVEDRASFSLNKIAEKAGVTIGSLREFYPNKSAILNDFYALIPDIAQVQTLDIEGYRELTLADKISNYIYTSFDILQEHRDFVEMTFHEPETGRNSKRWKSKSANRFRDFVDLDSRIPDLNRVIIPDFMYDFATNEYMALIQFWLKDESPGSEKSLALVDKLTAFIQVLLYSGTLDKGFDLTKYIMSQDVWKTRLKAFTPPFFDFNQFEHAAKDFLHRTSNCTESMPRPFCTKQQSSHKSNKSTGSSAIQIQVED